MFHPALLHIIQELDQLKETQYAILELAGLELPEHKKRQLLNCPFDPEPLPAIQRKVEEVQHEFAEDLRNGIYNSGL